MMDYVLVDELSDVNVFRGMMGDERFVKVNVGSRWGVKECGCKVREIEKGE